MGKLHSLRRAIKRNPDSFVFDNGHYKFPIGAEKAKTGWRGSFSASYRKFVKIVLKEIGYDIKIW